MKTPPIVSPEAWEAARLEMLVKERPSPELGTGWRPSVGGCRGCRLRRRINSKARRARLASSTCSKTAAN
jgi:hypothetical protein